MSNNIDTHGEEPADVNRTLYRFVLYVAGASPNSLRAIDNLQMICETYFAGNCQVEVIDVYKNQEAAKSNQIIALPLLLRKEPSPERRLIGDLSDTDKVVKILSTIA